MNKIEKRRKLLKEAIGPLPPWAEETGWMPKDPDINKVPDNEVVEKELFISPFKEKVNIEDESPEFNDANYEFYKSAVTALRNLEDQLEFVVYSDTVDHEKKQKGKLFKKLIEEFIGKEDSLKNFINTNKIQNEYVNYYKDPNSPKEIKKFEFRIQPSSKFTAVYLNFVNYAKKEFGITLPQLESLNGFKKYNPVKNFQGYVVFTTDPANMMGMSARSTWTSCQNPFSDKEQRYQVIPTALYKHVGMIYLTDGTQYLNRGEKINYRCLVRVVKSKTNDKVALFIDKMHPMDRTDIRELFKKSLSKNEDIPVISDLTAANQYYLEPDPNHYKYDLENESYYDTPFSWKIDLNKIKSLDGLLRSGDDSLKIELSKTMPINQLYKLISTDNSSHIKNAIVQRLINSDFTDEDMKNISTAGGIKFINILIDRLPKEKLEYFVRKYEQMSPKEYTEDDEVLIITLVNKGFLDRGIMGERLGLKL